MIIQISRSQIYIDLPQDLTILQPYVYLISCWIAVFVAALVFKHIWKAPNFRSGLISALSILIMYVACAMISFYEIPFLDSLIKPLPFIELGEDELTLTAYIYNENGKVCVRTFFTEVACMFVLGFLVSQVYDYQQGNLKTLGWLVFRLISTVFCIGIYYAFYKIMEKFIAWVPNDSYLKSVLPFLPIVLLGGLLTTFILGSLKKTMSHFYKMVNFTFDGLNGFYYSKKFGTMLTRGIHTTWILTWFFFCLQRVCQEYEIEPVITLGQYTPSGILSLIALVILWVIVGFLM